MTGIKELVRHMTLRMKLVSIAFLSMLIILVANLYIFSVLNTMNSQIEVVYTDNTSLKELGENWQTLNSVWMNM